ncbi:phosphohydrolase [bacterium]|nr:phosphohydrolase [bacterium]
MRRGGWIQTFTGKQFWPLDPRAEDVDIVDIAHALSLQTRYGGHCLRFYSVAEHSVHVASRVPDDLRLAALLHDASEAYLIDVPRPVKHSLAEYRGIEDRVMRAVFERFGIEFPLPDAIKAVDDRILLDELQQNMAAPPADWSVVGDPVGVSLCCWEPMRAKEEFSKMFLVYGGKV